MKLINPIPDGIKTDSFGWRNAIPGVVPAGLHNGQDWKAPVGTPIYSAADGIVYRRFEANGFGLYVYQQAGNGVELFYAHLSSIAVNDGTRVKAGQVIAYSGGARGNANSGASTGPHLHFSVRINGAWKDPIPYLTTPSTPKPTPAAIKRRRKEDEMIFGYVAKGAVNGATLYVVWRPGVKGSYWEFTGQTSANQLATQLGNAMALSKNTAANIKKAHK